LSSNQSGGPNNSNFHDKIVFKVITWFIFTTKENDSKEFEFYRRAPKKTKACQVLLFYCVILGCVVLFKTCAAKNLL
jgi:hypothetical protein